jgi:hypothetical protein
MRRSLSIGFVTALCVVASDTPGRAQSSAATIVQIDVENMVRDVADTPDPSKFAINAGLRPRSCLETLENT